MAIKFFNDHALDIVSNDDIKAIAPKAVELFIPSITNPAQATIFSAGLTFRQIMIKKNLQELRMRLIISRRMQMFLLLSVSVALTSVQEQLLKHLLLQTTMHLRKIHLTFTLLVILSAHLLSTKSYQSARAKIFALM